MLDTLKDVLVPDNESGVRYECTNCGETFDDARQECPECGATEIREVESFDMRPDA